MAHESRILVIFIACIFIPSAVLSCNSDQFMCSNGNCISLEYLCDGNINCDSNYYNTYNRNSRNRDDEKHCVCFNGPHCHRPPLPPCEVNKFQCSSGACIPKTWECDGEYDCTDLSDEHSKCERSTCAPQQYTCDNGACIDAQLKCNARNDCGDNSDEIVCQVHLANGTSNTNFAHCGDAFQCKDGTCIPQDNVCDPVKSKDCPDGSDEGGLCDGGCSDSRCDHGHKATPSGCQCTCREGYRLAGDGLTCVDVLECTQEPPVCSQLCEEQEGAYSCKCFKEFTMRYDNVTCKSTGGPPSIFYAVNNEIRQYLPIRRNLRVLHSAPGQLNAIEVDIASKLLYFSVQNDNSLYQLVIANGSRKSIANVGGATHIALDWNTRNVYFFSKDKGDTQTSLANSILSTEEPIDQSPSIDSAGLLQVCSFAKRHCATVAKFRHPVTALTVDALSKFLFYATVEINATDSTLPITRLHRSGLDGQNVRVIATLNQTITAITIDYRHMHLYVVRKASIDRLNYDGKNLVNIVETSIRIKGLNLFEDHLYFLTGAGHTMHKCRLFGNERLCTSFRLSADTTEMFEIVQNTRQTAGRNACATYNCSHLCVPGETGASCLCENGNIVDELSDCRE